jgi:hypothetical protein
MAGRYDRDFNFDFKPVTAEPEKARRRNDPLADILRFAGGIAPAAGTAIGAGIGSMAGGIGAIPGGMIGGALGTAAGGAANFGADQLTEGDAYAEEERVGREEERKARAQAAMSLLGSMG